MSYKGEVVVLVCGKFIMEKLYSSFCHRVWNEKDHLCHWRCIFIITEYEIKSFRVCSYVVSDQFMYKLCLIRKRNISTRRLFVTRGMTDAVLVKNAPSELTNRFR